MSSLEGELSSVHEEDIAVYFADYAVIHFVFFVKFGSWEKAEFM